jgi:hypothetical protein
MPLAERYEATELTESEKLQIQYEKDVFEIKLTQNEQALVNKILDKYSDTAAAANPLTNEYDTFKTASMSGNEGNIFVH